MSSRITSNYENAYTGDQELATRISALELRMVNVETSINCANPFRVTMNQAGSVGYVTTTSLIAAPKFTQQEACELVNKLIKEVLLCPDSADAFVELFKARDEIIARMTTAVQA